jgi:hypothetical protein
MKKAHRQKPSEVSLARYDWTKATRGRHAARYPRTAHAVVIDPELYAQYGSADAVNSALALLLQLRASLTQLPATPRRGKAA